MRALIATVLLAATVALSSVNAQEEGAVGATVFVDPLQSSLLIRPDRLQVGNSGTAQAQISNLGSPQVINVSATLIVDTKGIVISNGATRVVSSIAGGGTRKVDWRICGAVPGNYLAMVIVTADDAEGRAFQTETTAALVTVTKKVGRSQPC